MPWLLALIQGAGGAAASGAAGAASAAAPAAAAGMTAAVPAATGGLAGMSAAAPAAMAAPAAAGGAAGGGLGAGLSHALLGSGGNALPGGMVGPAAPTQGLLGVGGQLSAQGGLPHALLSSLNQRLGGIPGQISPHTFAAAPTEGAATGGGTGDILQTILGAGGGGGGSGLQPLPQGGILPRNAQQQQQNPAMARLGQKAPNYMDYLMGQNLGQRYF